MKTFLTLLIIILCYAGVTQHSPKPFFCETQTSKSHQEEEEAFNAFVLDFRDQGGHLDTEIRFIPTVVHIIMRNSADTITVERVKAQIAQTNRHMRRINPDTILTREMFRDVAADTHIEICLATLLPGGEEFEGVIWHHIPGFDQTMTEQVMESTIIDHNRYLNIWVRPVEAGAFASFPWMKDSSSDGIVVSHEHMGWNLGGDDPYSQGGKILTHELGHYLGLYHTFHNGFEFLGNCDFPHCDTITDRCCDTPVDWNLVLAPGDDCDFHPLYCGEDVWLYTQNENYMYYNPDHCLNMFSYDQRTRMRACISHIRSVLVSEENLAFTGAQCSPATSVGTLPFQWEIKLHPNPVKDVLTISGLPEGSGEKQISVFDIMGRRVISTSCPSDETKINFSNLPQGIYMVVIRAGNHSITRKVLRTGK